MYGLCGRNGQERHEYGNELSEVCGGNVCTGGIDKLYDMFGRTIQCGWSREVFEL